MTLSDDLDAHIHQEQGDELLEPFTTVSRSNKKGSQKPSASAGTSAGKGKGKRVERTLPERLLSRRETLEKTGYLVAFKRLVKDALLSNDDGEGERQRLAGDTHSCPIPACVVCLGLGSVAESSKSQDQYILLQTLLAELGDSGDIQPTMYDPAFTDEDNTFLTKDGFEVLTSEHSLSFTCPTLLYMPHCPRSLFDDLFRLNWSVEQLSRIIILGNRLDMYGDPSHPSASSSAKAPYVVKLIPFFESRILPPDETNFDVFNDLSLQWIPLERLLDLDEEFWEFDPSKSQLVPTEVVSARVGRQRKKRGRRGGTLAMQEGFEKLRLTREEGEEGWEIA